MKKIIFFLIFILLAAVTAASLNQDTQDTQDTQDIQDKDINLGRVYFPKAFVHAGKDYNKGVYLVTLTEKEGFPWFKIFNKNKELLFDEMAVVKPYKGRRRNFKYRVRKGLLKGYEYFRIRVIKPDKMIMAFFLVKQKESNSSKKKEDVN
jgi:hypothetical protein